MDENPIFKPINPQPLNNPNTQISGNVPPQMPANNPIPPSPIIPPPIPQAVQSTEPVQPSQSKLTKFVKIILGLIVAIGIVFFIYKIILPMVFSPKTSQVNLAYWGFEDPTVYNLVIADFEKANPNIKVEYSKQDLNQYKEKLITRSKNGNGPDIFSFHNTWIPEIAQVLLPLPISVISKEDFLKNYYPVTRADLIKNGGIYGIPSNIDTLNLFINRDLLQASGLSAPVTWAEFQIQARKLTVKDENNTIKTAGCAMGTYSNVTHAPDIISMLFAQDGVDPKKISGNEHGVEDALNFYYSFTNPVDNLNVWDDKLEQSIDAFAQGNLAMYFGYHKDIPLIKSKNPNLNFDVYLVPRLTEKDSTIANYYAQGVNAKTKHQKEAFLFIEYLSSKESAKKIFESQQKVDKIGLPYSRVDLAADLANTPAAPFVANAKSAVSTYFVDGFTEEGISTKLNKNLNVAIDSIISGASVQSASETLSQNFDDTLKQYGL